MPPRIEAGKGQHVVYTIRPANQADSAKLTAGNHYVGVDAVAWYLNKASTWFTDRMASGTLKVQLADGRESYEVALGTFELDGGSTIAPVFDKAVVPDRNYRGGVLTFSATLTALKKDTALAALLRSASRASLGVAAGMVATATVAGPAALLAAAGADLIQGVTGLLANGEKREPMFDFSGLEVSLRPEEVIGPECYLLFHRGSPLDESRLEVRDQGLTTLPYHAGALLEDGAWLLLRVRRSDEYSGVRPWHDEARVLRQRISDLVGEYFAHIIAKADAVAEFASSPAGSRTILDEYLRLRAVIGADGVLSEREASAHILQLRARLAAARESIETDTRAPFDAALQALTASFTRGAAMPGPLGTLLLDEVRPLFAARRSSIVDTTLPSRVAKLEGQQLFETLAYMPRLRGEHLQAIGKVGS